jgi:hypothetical protein
MPVIIGATEIVTEGLKNISGNNTGNLFNRFCTEIKQLYQEHDT